MSVFHGDWNDDPEEFLNSYLQCTAAGDDKFRARQFVNYLGACSNADDWYDELPQEEKKDWAAIEYSFRKRWLKEELGIKDIVTIKSDSNENQVLSTSPEIVQKPVSLPHKPSNTPTSSLTMSSSPTKPQTTPSQHSEPAQATATSPQLFSPPGPASSPAPKPPEIGPTQPVSLSQHLEISSLTYAATSQSPSPPENGKFSKISTTKDTASENLPKINAFSLPTFSNTIYNSQAHSMTAMALETLQKTTGFTSEVEKVEISPIYTKIIPQIPAPSVIEPENDTTRVYASLITPNDANLNPSTLPSTASSPYNSHIQASSGHEKSAHLRAIFESQSTRVYPAHVLVVTELKTRPEPNGFAENGQKVENALIFAQKATELVVSGHYNSPNSIYSSPTPTTITPALEKRSALAGFTKKLEIFTPKVLEPPILARLRLPTPFIPPTKHPCNISNLFYRLQHFQLLFATLLSPYSHWQSCFISYFVAIFKFYSAYSFSFLFYCLLVFGGDEDVATLEGGTWSSVLLQTVT